MRKFYLQEQITFWLKGVFLVPITFDLMSV